MYHTGIQIDFKSRELVRVLISHTFFLLIVVVMLPIFVLERKYVKIAASVCVDFESI